MIKKIIATSMLLTLSISMIGCDAETLQAISQGINSAYGGTSYQSSNYSYQAPRHPTYAETKARYERNNPTPTYQPPRVTINPTRSSSSSSSSYSNSSQRSSSSQTSSNNSQPSALIAVWQNKYEKWWAAGPTQKLWTSYDTREEALDYVYYDKDVISYVGKRGKFWIYKLNRSQTKADWNVRKWLQSEHGISTSDIP